MDESFSIYYYQQCIRSPPACPLTYGRQYQLSLPLCVPLFQLGVVYSVKSLPTNPISSPSLPASSISLAEDSFTRSFSLDLYLFPTRHIQNKILKSRCIFFFPECCRYLRRLRLQKEGMGSWTRSWWTLSWRPVFIAVTLIRRFIFSMKCQSQTIVELTLLHTLHFWRYFSFRAWIYVSRHWKYLFLSVVCASAPPKTPFSSQKSMVKGLGLARRTDEAFQLLESMEQDSAVGCPKLSAPIIYGLLNALIEAGQCVPNCLPNS